MSVADLWLMHRLLYGGLRDGYALLWIRQSRRQDWGRVLMPAWNPSAWVATVVAAHRQGASVLAQPYTFSKDPGPAASGRNGLHWYQATLVLTWLSTPPTSTAFADVTGVGGRILVSRRGAHIGLIRLARPRALSLLEDLGRELADGLGAVSEPRRRLPIADIGGARFLPVARGGSRAA